MGSMVGCRYLPIRIASTRFHGFIFQTAKPPELPQAARCVQPCVTGRAVDIWSGCKDLNLESLAPKASAMPDYATPRFAPLGLRFPRFAPVPAFGVPSSLNAAGFYSDLRFNPTHGARELYLRKHQRRSNFFALRMEDK